MEVEEQTKVKLNTTTFMVEPGNLEGHHRAMRRLNPTTLHLISSLQEH